MGTHWHGWPSEAGTSSICNFCECHEGSLNMVSFHLMWGPYCKFKEFASKGTGPQGQEDKLPLLLFWMSQRIFPERSDCVYVHMHMYVCVCLHMRTWPRVHRMAIPMLQFMDRPFYLRDRSTPISYSPPLPSLEQPSLAAFGLHGELLGRSLS